MELVNESRPVSVKLVEVLGVGTFSTVYLAKNVENELEEFALKFCSAESYMLEVENDLNEQIRSKCKNVNTILPVIGKIRSGYDTVALAYPVACSVAQSAWIKPERVVKLTDEHYRQLWIKLNAIHRAGIAHRDIRSDNIVVHNDEAYFVDFGCSCKLGVIKAMSGSIATASQRILHLLSRKYEKFEYRIEDDLESFYKMFLWNENNLEFPAVKSEMARNDLAELYFKFWYRRRMFFNNIQFDVKAKIDFIEKAIFAAKTSVLCETRLPTAKGYKNQVEKSNTDFQNPLDTTHLHLVDEMNQIAKSSTDSQDHLKSTPVRNYTDSDFLEGRIATGFTKIKKDQKRKLALDDGELGNTPTRPKGKAQGPRQLGK